MLRIRAFWAPDDTETGQKFAEGHFNVLSEIGVKKVTSSSEEWINSPLVYVVVCETEEGEVVGGARLHIAQEDHPLPMQLAISRVDPNINKYVGYHIPEGTAELCGLWNTRKVAGKGIGIRLMPMAAIALTHIVGINSLFALVAKHTLKQSLAYGFRRFEKVGDRGEFNYPKLDLVATTVFIEDTKSFENVRDPEEKEFMQKLRTQKNFKKEVHYPKGSFMVHLDINIEEGQWKKYIESREKSG